MSDGGKGSTPRPIPDWETFSSNFDKIFGTKNASKTQDTQDTQRQEEGTVSRADSEQADAKSELR